jgi:hypothetical protein
VAFKEHRLEQFDNFMAFEAVEQGGELLVIHIWEPCHQVPSETDRDWFHLHHLFFFLS